MMGKARRAPGFDDDGVAILVMPHVQLADRVRSLRAVGDAIDHKAAHATNALAAVMIKSNWLITCQGELVVEQIKHLQEGGIGADVIQLVVHQTDLLFGHLPAAKLVMSVSSYSFSLTCSCAVKVARI